MSQEMLNKVINRYVAYHKQIEKRFDGSAGGIYGALVETVVKENFYFTGTAFDYNLHLKHVVTNDPEKIGVILGYKPFESDHKAAIVEIKNLLSRGEKVLFCGTPSQCLDLKKSINVTDNLILVDIIDTIFSSEQSLIDFAGFCEEKYNSKVVDIRFFNKEFAYKYSKRVLFENGRVVFLSKKDCIDESYENKLREENHGNSIFNSLDERIGDISLCAYRMTSNDDGLGYSYISVNTSKGQALFEKAKKRLVVVLSENEVNRNNIVTNDKLHNDIFKKSLSKQNWFKRNVKAFLKKILITNFLGKDSLFVNSTQLRLKPVFQFIKYNYFNKNVITDKKKNGFIYFTPYCSVQIEKDAKIELHGPLVIGKKRISCSKQETRLWMQPKSKIIVQERASFGYGSNVEIYKGAVLEIGALSSNSEIIMICGNHITIGSPVNIARGCTIRDTNGHIVAVQGFKESREVMIGNHVWICSDSTIMPGTSIGDGSIVGACSYITKRIPSFTMVQGSADNIVGYPKYFRM